MFKWSISYAYPHVTVLVDFYVTRLITCDDPDFPLAEEEAWEVMRCLDSHTGILGLFGLDAKQMNYNVDCGQTVDDRGVAVVVQFRFRKRIYSYTDSALYRYGGRCNVVLTKIIERQLWKGLRTSVKGVYHTWAWGPGVNICEKECA